MSAEKPGKRGAPKGNQNARKHGFYSRVLEEAERLDFKIASSVDGIDEVQEYLEIIAVAYPGIGPASISPERLKQKAPG